MVSNKEKYPKITEMPYYNTRVSAERTKAEIIKLLEKNDIESHQWTKHENKETLKFIFSGVVQGKEIKLGVHLDLPIIKAIKGRYNEVIEVPKPQAYRIFYYTLKSMLEATKYGVLKKEEIFYSFILTQLPNGTYVRIKDLIEKQLLLPEKVLQ